MRQPHLATVYSALASLLAAWPSAALHAQDLPAPGRHAVVDVTIVDVEARALRPHQTVLVDGERILSVGAQDQVKVPAGFTAIDGKGLFLLPGLFDAHAHMADPDTFAPMMVAHGVVFAREMGSDTDTGLQLRQELRDGERLGPELIVCGAIIDGRPPVWPFSEACETADEARAAVTKLADAGVDQIKVYSLLRAEVYHAAVTTAQARGLKAVGHIPVEVGLDAALAAGQATCEHLTGFDIALGQLAGHNIKLDRRQMFGTYRHWSEYDKIERPKILALCKKVKDAGMVLCPTLIVMDRVANMSDPATTSDPLLQFVSPGMRAFWDSGTYSAGMTTAMQAALPFQKALVKDLFDAGVTVLCGSDLANPYVIPGVAVHAEMALLQAAGIPAPDVLATATVNPARFFGVADRLGAIDDGKTASMVLVRQDPLLDVRHAREVAGVFLRGRWFDRGALDGVLEQVRATAKGATAEAAAAEAAARQVPLQLPGEVVARGNFESTFNGQPSDSEEFLITKTPDGYHVAARITPRSAFSQPSTTHMNYGPDFILRNGTYETGSKKVVRARYELRDGKLVANARSGDKDLTETALELPAGAVVVGPTNAFEFATHNRLRLAVDDEKVYPSVGFGYPDWKPATTDVRVKRLADTTLELGGKEHAARHFEISFSIPLGKFAGEMWFDTDNVLLKSRLKMPFGTIEVARAMQR